MTRALDAPTVAIRVRVRRGGPLRTTPTGWQTFSLEVPGSYTVAELLEVLREEHDSTLVYRHSCHHGSCGTCAMRINGTERLACTTGVSEVVNPGGILTLEPLDTFRWVADLATDSSEFVACLAQLGPGHRRADAAFSPPPLPGSDASGPLLRLSDCIECGACVSACPVSSPASGYLGPAALVAARDAVAQDQEPGGGWPNMEAAINGTHGVWQCHHAFECTRVCPAGVDVAGAIMALRRTLLSGSFPARGVQHG